MTPDTYLALDDLTFSRYEVPQNIVFGGEQALAVHELVGGKRIVDAMGRQDKTLDWSGIFVGSNASDRARYLNYLRVAGGQHVLTWGEYWYTVIIKSAILDFRRFYEISYSISCVVVEDNTIPVTVAPPSPIDTAIGDDMNTCNTLGGLIGDGPLSTLLATLSSAISTVSTFANAAQSLINSVLAPIAAVQSRITVLIASTGNTIANISTVGGVLPNSSIAMQSSKLSTQIAGYTQLPMLLNLQSATGRMGMNLGAISSSGTSTTLAGGNLFALASKAYGDPSAYTTIARANNITDPQLIGVNTILVPKIQDNSGGIFGG